MKTTKRDIELIRWAIDICETNIEAGDEHPDSPRRLEDLKQLLKRMLKSEKS